MQKYWLVIFLLFTLSKVQAQPLYCIDSFAFEGDFKTKTSLLERELNITKGNCITIDSLSNALKLAEKRLFNTQLFNKVSVDTINIDQKNVILFTLDERFPIFPKPNIEFADRNFNVWWAEQGAKFNRLNLGLGIVHQNVRGRREVLTAEAQIGYTRKMALSYSIPFVDKAKQHGIGASIAMLNNMELAYQTEANKLLFKRFEANTALQQFEASVQYTYRPQFASTHQLSLQYSHIKIHDSIAHWYNPNYLGDKKTAASIIGLAYRFQYNAVDNWNYPLEGFRSIGMANLDYQIGGQLLPSIHWQADWYQKLSKNWYYNFILRGRKAFGNQLPYFMQKNMGHDYDEMRGYEYYVHDGTFFSLLRANLKYRILDEQIRLPIRYFRHIPIRLFLKGYSDAGYAYNTQIGTNTLNNKGLYSYGIGLDIVTLYDIRIRLEYTINNNGQSDLYLHKSGE